MPTGFLGRLWLLWSSSTWSSSILTLSTSTYRLVALFLSPSSHTLGGTLPGATILPPGSCMVSAHCHAGVLFDFMVSTSSRHLGYGGRGGGDGGLWGWSWYIVLVVGIRCRRSTFVTLVRPSLDLLVFPPVCLTFLVTSGLILGLPPSTSPFINSVRHLLSVIPSMLPFINSIQCVHVVLTPLDFVFLTHCLPVASGHSSALST
ncbi:hypothetical protein BDN67DRAFT_1013883 [Paxillus ammoniavirescens]|nr:hypothetical protein BDN67DRAFT_1013883 [Paxillus ammoniavirescens]